MTDYQGYKYYKFQSPCGCELQCSMPRHRQILLSFYPLAGVSCSSKHFVLPTWKCTRYRDCLLQTGINAQCSIVFCNIVQAFGANRLNLPTCSVKKRGFALSLQLIYIIAQTVLLCQSDGHIFICSRCCPKQHRLFQIRLIFQDARSIRKCCTDRPCRQQPVPSDSADRHTTV